MIRRCNLPDEIRLPCGAVLMPVIGGHLKQKPFLTVARAGVDVTKSGWGNVLLNLDARFERAEATAIINEARYQKLKYRRVMVLSRNLRGKLDLHHRPYTGTNWVFVEVKEES